MLWELLQFLWPITFEIPAYLGMVSYTINAAVRLVLAVLLPALTSGCVESDSSGPAGHLHSHAHNLK